VAVSRELRLYAHRGASALLPENTMAAFERGLRDGATALELDVHRTRDGHFAVCHDPDGTRVAGRPERVRDLTLAEVQAWDVGHGFVDGAGRRPHAGRGHRVPALEAVLAAFPAVPLSVELKGDDVAAVPALVELVCRLANPQLVTLASFSNRVVRTIRAVGYPGPTALTKGEVTAVRFLPPHLSRRLVRGQAAHVPPRRAWLRLDTDTFLERCRRFGLRSEYWTVNDADVARDLVARGATGIMTDDPALILPALPGLVPSTA
jgi:glycerophosphoryl diester phosphodiesterase